MGSFERNDSLWGYGTDLENEHYEVTEAELKLNDYISNNSAIMKRKYWHKRHEGLVLIKFNLLFHKVTFLNKNELTDNLPNNIARDALNYIVTNGEVKGRVEGLIVVGQRGNDYSIQDYPLQGRDVGLPYLVK